MSRFFCLLIRLGRTFECRWKSPTVRRPKRVGRTTGQARRAVVNNPGASSSSQPRSTSFPMVFVKPLRPLAVGFGHIDGHG